MIQREEIADHSTQFFTSIMQITFSEIMYRKATKEHRLQRKAPFTNQNSQLPSWDRKQEHEADARAACRAPVTRSCSKRTKGDTDHKRKWRVFVTGSELWKPFLGQFIGIQKPMRSRKRGQEGMLSPKTNTMRIPQENQETVYKFSQVLLSLVKQLSVNINYGFSIKNDGSNAYAGQWSQMLLSPCFLLSHFLSLKSHLHGLSFLDISNLDFLKGYISK